MKQAILLFTEHESKCPGCGYNGTRSEYKLIDKYYGVYKMSFLCECCSHAWSVEVKVECVCMQDIISDWGNGVF